MNSILRKSNLSFFCFVFCFTLAFSMPLYANDASQKEVVEVQKSGLGKRFGVFVRGVVNIVTLPLEVPRTFFEERKRNPEHWEWSFVPRTLENVVGRGLSAVNDSVFLTFLKNSEDLENPWTRQWDLPDYAWSKQQYKSTSSDFKEEERYTMIGVRG